MAPVGQAPYTLAAADALGVIGRLCDLDVHLACLRARAARDASVLVNLYSKQGYLVHERIESAERADPFAKWAVDEHAQDDHSDQNDELPGEQRSQCGAYATIDDGERNRAFEHSLRAEVLAEVWVAHPDVVDKQRGQQNHGEQQYDVLQVPKRFEFPCGQLLARDFIQQLLQPTEGAEESTHETPQQHADENQKPGHVVREAELRRSQLPETTRWGRRLWPRGRNSSSGRVRRPLCPAPDR